MKVALIQEPGSSINTCIQTKYPYEFVESVDSCQKIDEVWFVLSDNAFCIDLNEVCINTLNELELAVKNNIPICVVYKRKSDGKVKVYPKSSPELSEIIEKKKQKSFSNIFYPTSGTMLISSNSLSVSNSYGTVTKKVHEKPFDKRLLLLYIS